MNYFVGSSVQIKLYSGEVTTAIVTAIYDQSSGRKVQITFGGVTILVSPDQILKVLN
jgi:hypothetical protein